MIFKTQNISILRYALIVFLTVVMSASAFYLYFHYNKAATVRYNFRKVIQNRGNSALIDSTIIALFDAGNNSRMYALTKDNSYYNQFSAEMQFVSDAIHQINISRPDNFNTEGQQVDYLLAQKSQRTEDYFRLLSLTDSLLKTTQKITKKRQHQDSRKFKSELIGRISAKIRKDSLHQQVLAPAPKPKFFSRFFSAFSKKKSERQINTVQANSINAVQKKVDSIITHTTYIDKAAADQRVAYKNLLSLNNEIKKNELEISTITGKLINAIITDLRKYKQEEQSYIDVSNLALDDNLQEVVYDFKRISTLFFILLVLTVILVFYNIWKIFQNEEQLLSNTESAQQEAKSKTAFLASMSHEIRTPLNSVIGFSEQLMDTDLNTVQTAQAKAISSSSKMLLHVVNEILDFSKYETGKMQLESIVFKPQHALLDVFTNMEVLAANKGLKLLQEIDIAAHVTFTGDELRLKQVVINLLNNAVKFTTKGSITLKAWTTNPDEEGQLNLHVQVIDSGIGIDEAHLPYIFEEFSQVESAQHKTTQKGTGLGLAICKKIVELQGGTIGVSSKSGEGSVFSFQLNYEVGGKQEELEPASISAAEPALPALTGKHVLVADDNELNLLLVTTILKKWKISYDTALNGADALEMVNGKPYDLLLTDIEMPLMDGITLSQNIRQFGTAKSQIPILALTANALPEDTNKYLDAGMNGVIVKPITEQNFMNSIRTALQD